MMKRLLTPALVFGAAALASGSAGAVDYYLCAGAVSKTMPDSSSVPMWGFAQVANAPAQVAGCGAGATVPGPRLSVPVGDALTIHLYNDGLPEPVSVVIPGQAMPAGSSPVFFTDTQGMQRVRSFADETPPGSAHSYNWPALASGTYPYHSGTHPQVQVQMGLYGAITKDTGVGEAYAGVPYDAERDLFYSEIDPALHTAVANGSYGTTGPTSTLDYVPKYFLINGEPYEVGDPCIDGGLTQGDRILLRLFNESLRELTPTMIGSHFDVVAEGGKQYPFARRQYSVLLQPGSTKDIVFTPNRAGSFPIIDRRLNLTNPVAGVPVTVPGGFQICLSVNSAAGKHVGDLDNFSDTINPNVWRGRVRIEVHDQNHNRLPGVIVTGSWNPAGFGTNTTCTTNANGRCQLARRFSINTPEATMTVTGLTGAGGSYLSADNHDPDADSNGTSITVPRP